MLSPFSRPGRKRSSPSAQACVTVNVKGMRHSFCPPTPSPPPPSLRTRPYPRTKNSALMPTPVATTAPRTQATGSRWAQWAPA